MHDDTTIETGSIARLVADRGFGFITAPSRPDFFFHAYALQNCAFGDLHVGMTVTFAPVPSDRGWRAERVSVVGA